MAALTAFGAKTDIRQAKAPAHHVQTLDDYDDYDDYDPVWEAPDGELTMLDRECEAWNTEAFNAEHSHIYGSISQMVEAEDGSIWLYHMVSEYPVGTWIKAERDGNQIKIVGAQYLYPEYDYDEEIIYMLYVVPMKKVIEGDTGTYVATDDMTYTFNVAEDGTLTSADPELLLGLCVENPYNEGEWVWKGFGDYNITMRPVTAENTGLPEGLTAEDWVWQSPGETAAFVGVAIQDNDIYISGLDRDLPDTWVKGTIANGKATFPSGQYLGPDFETFYYHYLCGCKLTQRADPETGEFNTYAEMTDNIVFTYDAEKKLLTLEGEYMTNGSATQLCPLSGYGEVTVMLQKRNPLAAPAAPFDLLLRSDYGAYAIDFQIPNVDVDDNIIKTSNLYYEITADDQVVTFTLYTPDWDSYTTELVPYSYDDQMDFWAQESYRSVYIYADEPQKSVSVRSVYINENGDKLYSEPCVYEVSGVENVTANRQPVSTQWFDLQGRPATDSARGISIRVTTYSDGSVSRSKVVR